MEGPTRICLEFEDRRILSKSQRRDHLRRSWLLLRPESFSTVADVAAHISNVFSLRRTCPFGLLLYMDEFVLPPFESTSIFRDSDIIRVKKKASKHKKIQIEEDAIQDTDDVARQCMGIFLEQSETKKRKSCADVCDIKQIAMNRKRLDQLHANTVSPLHDTDATHNHEKAPLQNLGKERMVEGSSRGEDAVKKTHEDAAPANNWEVEVAKVKSVVSATHVIEIPSDSSKDLMNQTENNSLLPQNGWDHWIANKNPRASWAWGVIERNPSRYGRKSGSYTSGKHLDSDKVKSVVSATHVIEIPSDSSKDLMNQTENNSLLPQNGWDQWIANKNAGASRAWGVIERSPSRWDLDYDKNTSGKHLDSDEYTKSKW